MKRIGETFVLDRYDIMAFKEIAEENETEMLTPHKMAAQLLHEFKNAKVSLKNRMHNQAAFLAGVLGVGNTLFIAYLKRQELFQELSLAAHGPLILILLLYLGSGTALWYALGKLRARRALKRFENDEWYGVSDEELENIFVFLSKKECVVEGAEQ